MARVTEHTLYFSDVRIELRCNSARISDWVERRWRGAQQSMLPLSKTFRMVVNVDLSLRIAFEDELLYEAPVGVADENVVEIYLYRSMLAEHRRRFGVFHGGAVVLNGTPWVFCGPSGAGKSSLVTAALRRGGRFFTDEYIVTDGKLLWGWARTPEVEPLGAQRKAAYPLRSEQVAAAPAAARLVRFAYLSPGRSTRIRPLSAPETLRHWHEAAFHDSPAGLGELVGGSRSWIATWRDPSELLGRLEEAAHGGPQAAHALAR